MKDGDYKSPLLDFLDYFVFASEEFAALAAADQAKGFSCDLVGTTSLAKSYGLFRVYSLEWVTE